MSSSIGIIIPKIWDNKKWQPNHQPATVSASCYALISKIADDSAAYLLLTTTGQSTCRQSTCLMHPRRWNFARETCRTLTEELKQCSVSSVHHQQPPAQDTVPGVPDIFQMLNIEMYIYIYTCVYIYIYTHVFLYMYIYIYI